MWGNKLIKRNEFLYYSLDAEWASKILHCHQGRHSFWSSFRMSREAQLHLLSAQSDHEKVWLTSLLLDESILLNDTVGSLTQKVKGCHYEINCFLLFGMGLHVFQDSLKFTMWLKGWPRTPHPPECWDYRHLPLCQVYVVLEIKPRLCACYTLYHLSYIPSFKYIVKNLYVHVSNMEQVYWFTIIYKKGSCNG